MQTPVQITFRHMETSAAVETRIHELIERLERHYDRIIGCHVVVDAPAAHRNKGAPFAIKIDITVPGSELHIHSDRGKHEDHTDCYVALRDAFEAANRALQDYARLQRGEVKRHANP